MKKFYVIGGILFFMGWILSISLIATKPNSVGFYDKAKSMNSRVQVYLDDRNVIYTSSDVRPAIQAYSLSGDFLYGIDVPTEGAYDPVVQNDTLYIHVIRGEYYYVIQDGVITKMDSVTLSQEPKALRNKHGNNEYEIYSFCFHTILIKSKSTNEISLIKLKDTPTRISWNQSGILSIIGFFIVMMPRIIQYQKSKASMESGETCKGGENK